MDSESDKLVRLLIVDEGPHKAEQVTSLLRATGMHVRAEFADNSEVMCHILENKLLDLVLFSSDLADFTLKQAQYLIRECGRHVALIVMCAEPTPDMITQSIEDGAQDLVSSQNPKHLVQVLKREAYNLSLWRKVKHLEMVFLESEKRCQILLANSKDAVAYVHEGIHIYANEPYMELFGHADLEELEGTPIMDMIDASQQNDLKAFLRDFSQSKTSENSLNLKLIHSSGEKLDATLEFSKASFDGEPCTQILIRSITDTSELEEQINYLRQHDMISGLYNRHFFMDSLKTSVTQAINGIQQSVVIYISLDNFQSIRDRVGISGCDVLIGDIANLIKQHLPDGYTIARFGPYSYSCLGVINDRQAVEKLAEKIPSLVENQISEVGKHSISATCSVSACFIDENSPDNANEVIARAERTCEEMQSAGGSNFRVYVPKEGEMTQEEADELVAAMIKEVLNQNRIVGLYQPIVSIKTEPGERYYSSLEISNSDGKKLYQDDYGDAAERTGTAKMLDRWKILHAIKSIKQGASSRKTEIFIPLSISSIQDAGLARWISDNLTKAKLSGEQFVFMASEAHVANYLRETKTLVKALKQMHCQFGLNEFGIGQNPFQLIKHIDISYVHINIAYMEHLVQNTDNQDTIRELASRTSSMRIRSITPGIEDAAMLSVLWSLGVDFVQGGFLQPPDKAMNYDFLSM